MKISSFRALFFIAALSTLQISPALGQQLGGGGGGLTPPGGTTGQTQFNNAGAFGGYTPSGDLTVNTSTGVETIANSAVTLAKIATAIASSKLLGSGASGSGAAYSEITLGTNLSMTGTTLNATGGVTTTGSPATGNLAKFSGASSLTNGDLSGDVTTSGALAATIAANAVTTSKINNAAVTLAKVANAAANSVLVGSGSSGTGAAYSEITVGSGLTMTGTTLTASGGSGTVSSISAGNGLATVAGTCNSGAITTSGTVSACNDVVTKTANYTLLNGDGGVIIITNAAGGLTITVPAASSSGNFARGWGNCIIDQLGTTTVTAATGTPFYGSVGTAQSTFSFVAGQTACLSSDGTNWAVSGGSPPATIAGIFTTQSGRVEAVRVITASGAVTVATTDQHVCIAKTTPATTTVNLPSSPTVGTIFTIDDCGGNGVSFNYTITPAAGNIDGSTTFVISTNYGSWSGYYANSAWHTLAAR